MDRAQCTGQGTGQGTRQGTGQGTRQGTGQGTGTELGHWSVAGPLCLAQCLCMMQLTLHDLHVTPCTVWLAPCETALGRTGGGNRANLKGKREGRFTVLDGRQEAGNVEGGRHLHQVGAAQPADGLPCLSLHPRQASDQLWTGAQVTPQHRYTQR